MPLTDDERKMLDQLLAKDKEPEPAANGSRNVDVYIDLSDEAAVDRAIGFGLLTRAEAKQLDEETPDPETDDETRRERAKRPPRKAGYFGKGDED